MAQWYRKEQKIIQIVKVYGIGCMVKDHSGSENENPQPPLHGLLVYGIGHIIKDHSDSERGNPLPPPSYQ